MYEESSVPPDESTDPPFDHLVARELRFTLGWNRVDVIGQAKGWDIDPSLMRSLEERECDVSGSIGTGVRKEGIEGGVPLGGLAGIDIDQLVHEVVRYLVNLRCAHRPIFPSDALIAEIEPIRLALWR